MQMQEDTDTCRGVNRRPSHDVLFVLPMFKNLGAIPEIVGYRTIIVKSRTMSYEIVRFYYDWLLRSLHHLMITD
jgi:hypothetical protein